jgi:hypothetical protein
MGENRMRGIFLPEKQYEGCGAGLLKIPRINRAIVRIGAAVRGAQLYRGQRRQRLKSGWRQRLPFSKNGVFSPVHAAGFEGGQIVVLPEFPW